MEKRKQLQSCCNWFSCGLYLSMTSY